MVKSQVTSARYSDWVVVMGGTHYPVESTPLENGDGHDVCYGGETYRVLSDWQFGQPLFKGVVNEAEVCLMIERRNMIYRLFHWGSQVDVMVMSPMVAELQALRPVKAPPNLSKFLMSPMPGLLAKLSAQVGQEVKAGRGQWR